MKHLILSLVTCGLLATAGFAGPSDNSLSVATAKEIQTLDGLYSAARENIILTHLTSDQLVTFDAASGSYKPALAESFEFETDTAILFTLRDGVTFHDGDPVTADDIVYSFEWVANAESKSRNSKRVSVWFDRIEKVGENSVRVHMKSPYPLALSDIEKLVLTRKSGTYGSDGAANPDAMSQQFVGTGPYKVVAFDMGKGVTLERYEDYYSGGAKPAGSLDKITLRPIPEWGTIIAELMSRGVEFSYGAPDDIANDLESVPFIQRVPGPSLRVAYIVLDAAGKTGADNPMTDIRVRRALNHAVNRDEIVKHLVGGSARVVNSACSPAQFGCEQDVRVYEYDPEKARALLAEAGHGDGLEVTLWAYRDRPVVEAIAADLAQVGVTANVQLVKLPALVKAVQGGEASMIHSTWASYSVPDVAAFSNHFIQPSLFASHGDQEVSDLFVQGQSTLDPEARMAAYSKALKKFADQAYWVPLYQGTQNYIALEGLNFAPADDELIRLNEFSW